MEIKQAVEYAIENYSCAIEYKGELIDYLYDNSLQKGVCCFLNRVVNNKVRSEIRNLGFNLLCESIEIREKYASMQPSDSMYWFWVEPYECATEEDMIICLEARKTVLEEILKTL